VPRLKEAEGAKDPIPEAEGETVSKKEKKDKRKQTKRKEKKAERNPKRKKRKKNEPKGSRSPIASPARVANANANRPVTGSKGNQGRLG